MDYFERFALYIGRSSFIPKWSYVFHASPFVHPPGCSEDMLNIQTKANNLWIDFFSPKTFQPEWHIPNEAEMRLHFFCLSVCLSLCRVSPSLDFLFLYGLAGRQLSEIQQMCAVWGTSICLAHFKWVRHGDWLVARCGWHKVEATNTKSGTGTTTSK